MGLSILTEALVVGGRRVGLSILTEALVVGGRRVLLLVGSRGELRLQVLVQGLGRVVLAVPAVEGARWLLWSRCHAESRWSLWLHEPRRH